MTDKQTPPDWVLREAAKRSAADGCGAFGAHGANRKDSDMGDPVIVGTTWVSSHEVTDMKARIDGLTLERDFHRESADLAYARIAELEGELAAAREFVAEAVVMLDNANSPTDDARYDYVQRAVAHLINAAQQEPTP
jgi:hypothetical protein